MAHTTTITTIPTATSASTTTSAPAKKGWSFNIRLAYVASLAVILFIVYTVADKKGWIEGGYSELSHPTDTRKREVKEAIVKRQEIETKSIPERIINDGDDSAITDFNKAEGAKYRRLNLLEGGGENKTPPSSSTATREPIRTFALLDPSKKAYQLDAREEWRELDVTAVANDRIYIKTDPSFRVCSADADPCADGNGLHLPAAGNDKYHPTWYPFGDGAYYALIGRWGSDGQPFSIGTEYSGIIPASADGKKLQVMANVQAQPQTLAPNTGGHRITEITIQ